MLGNTITGNSSFGIFAGANAGYGNNSLSGNNGAGPQVSGGDPLQPNLCNGMAC